MFKFLKNLFGTPKRKMRGNEVHTDSVPETEFMMEQRLQASELLRQAQLIKRESEQLLELKSKIEIEIEPQIEQPEVLPQSPSKLRTDFEPKKTPPSNAQNTVKDSFKSKLTKTELIKQVSETDLQTLLSENRLCLIPASQSIQNTTKLFKLLLHPLSALEQMRLMGMLFDQLDKNVKPNDALLSLLGEDGQSWGQWILIKAHSSMIDEFEWQAQELAYNWNLPDNFKWQAEGEITRDNALSILQNAFRTYEDWLISHNFNLVMLKSDKHSVTTGAFILPCEKLPEFQQLANDINLSYEIE